MLKYFLKPLVLKLFGAAIWTALAGFGFYHALLQVMPEPSAASAPLVPEVEDSPPVVRPVTPAPPMRTVWLSAVADVTDEGVETRLTAESRECELPSGSRRMGAVLTRTAVESLTLHFKKGICIPVPPSDAVDLATSVSGLWWSVALDELPELTNSVKQWSYRTPTGQRRYVTLAAVGYCLTEDGDCSGGVSLQDAAASAPVYAHVFLKGAGVGPVFLAPPRL